MRTVALLIVTPIMLVIANPRVQAQRADSAMVGSWEGRAQIDVPWTAVISLHAAS